MNKNIQHHGQPYKRQCHEILAKHLAQVSGPMAWIKTPSTTIDNWKAESERAVSARTPAQLIAL
jgi:hypothetical protein